MMLLINSPSSTVKKPESKKLTRIDKLVRLNSLWKSTNRKARMIETAITSGEAHRIGSMAKVIP